MTWRLSSAVLLLVSVIPMRLAGQGGGPAGLASVIDQLGAYHFRTSTEAARSLRRIEADVAASALEQAVTAHGDSYVRFRALVILSGLGQASTPRFMRGLIADPNDRIRTAVFQWLERYPDPAVLPALVAALNAERSEFVRPALTRAVAAQLADVRARSALLPLVSRGEDVFRGAVIEALGDYRGQFALSAISDVARRDGPLQDDAITAIGKIGDGSAIGLLAQLQQQVPPPLQPTVAAAFCLLNVKCDEQRAYLERAFAHAVAVDDPPLLRGTVHALGVLAGAGQPWAMTTLLERADVQLERVRAPLALGLGLLAIRHPRQTLEAIEGRGVRAADLEIMRDAFDMLSEEFGEEQFYGELRRQFWSAPPGSPSRRTAERLIEILEF